MRHIPLFLTTGLATVLAGSLLMQQAAHAAGLDPREVTKLLAKSQAMDNRCKILTPAESQDLRDIVARAEIALAGKYSVAVAKQQLAAGRAQGLAAPCDESAAAQVRNVLKAGLQATSDKPQVIDEPPAAVAQQASAQPAAPKQSVAVAKPAPEVTPDAPAKPLAKPELANKVPQPAVAPKKPIAAASKKQVAYATMTKGTVLASYAGLAENYYVELRCHTMPLSSARRMYQDVLAQHRAALSSNGPSAVRKLLSAAQARAGARSCS